MNQHNAAKLYKETSIRTAEPGKLIVLLYEEIDKHLNEAIVLLSQDSFKVYDKVNHHITRAQQIIIELATALNKSQNEEFYNNMFRLYLYFNDELVQANITKDHKKIAPIQKMIRELLEAWRDIAGKTKAQNSGQKTGINLAG